MPGAVIHSYVESKMGTRVRRFDLAKSTPKFAAKREEDSNLRQRINVLATLAMAFLQTVEDLRSAVTKATTNRSRAVRPLDRCASVQCDNPIDFYKEVERYEIDLIQKALKHTAGNQRRAAQLLNLNATTLNAKIKNYDINTLELAAQSAAILRLALDTELRAHETIQTVDQQGAQALTRGARRKATGS
jgi:DNA-binding NtrC family response regulator